MTIKLRMQNLSRVFISLCFLMYCLFGISTAAIAEIAEKDLPASLPMPTTSALPAEVNTPEYVIIKPSDQVTFSSETVAAIANINVKEGSIFHKGDILLQFDCRVQKAELDKALAQHLEAKMAEEAARRLLAYGSISKFEYVKATSDEQITKADVDKLGAMVEKCVIKAPFNGAVSELMVHAHESVKPGDPILKIVNTENLEFEMQIPSPWLSWLHVGSLLYVHINENNKTVSARVTKINPEIEPVSQSVKIVAAITPSDPSLSPGMSGQANFPDNPTNKQTTSKK